MPAPTSGVEWSGVDYACHSGEYNVIPKQLTIIISDSLQPNDRHGKSKRDTKP